VDKRLEGGVTGSSSCIRVYIVIVNLTLLPCLLPAAYCDFEPVTDLYTLFFCLWHVRKPLALRWQL
jgi:hypothetical protein